MSHLADSQIYIEPTFPDEKSAFQAESFRKRDRSALRRAVMWKLVYLALALIPSAYLLFFHHSSSSSSSKPNPVSGSRRPASHSPNQCPQVEPLFPRRTNDALEWMDNYLRSDAYFHYSSDLLSSAIQYRTVTWDDMGRVGEDERWDTFPEFASWLERSFPGVNSTLQLDMVNTHSVVYTWGGSDSSLQPILLTAHQDVVPVNDDSLDQWEHPPWSGDQDDHYIWGRGSVDTKDTLLGVMEAVEQLIDASFQPRRTVILAFGFDEEIKGPQGAAHIATFLEDQYGKDGIAVIVDEGSTILDLWGADFALPAVAEKGSFDLEITVNVPGGHSSMPPKHTGIGIMSQLITMIEDDIFSPKLDEDNPFIDALRCGAAHGPRFPPDWAHHLLEDELDLLVEDVSFHPLFSFLCKTTVAVDVIHGGIKINALPETTTVSINHRVNIGDTIDGIKNKYTELAASVAERHNLYLSAFDDSTPTEDLPSTIVLVSKYALDPAPLTPTSIDGTTPFSVFSGTTRALYGQEVIVAPALTTGNTDTRHYWDLTRHIFRFSPGWDPRDEGLGNAHTVNERVGASHHVAGVQWYSLFIRNMDEADL